jgi:tetratricopeptide (TPR) repeat protein
MSGSRNDPKKAKLRRERIRKEKQAQRIPAPSAIPPPLEHPFASERSMRDIHALLEGQQFENVEDINERLAELTSGGRLPQAAAAWKQDDPKWQAQQLAYDALETDDPFEALRLVQKAQELDPDCTDAQRLAVSLMPMEEHSRLRLMREVVERAEKNLGEDFFTENVGHFWGVVETRPYMRAKLHLAELLCQQGSFDESIAVYERILELNPSDNLGVCFPLLGLYLAQNYSARAAAFLDQSPEAERRLASPAWARVLERWLAGDLPQAQAALTRARKVNRYAEPYVSGRKPIPAEGPTHFRPGDETDAQVCAFELALAWRAHPGFREWLRQQPPAPR